MARKVPLLVTYKLSPANLERIEAHSPDLKVYYSPENLQVERHLPEAEIVFGRLEPAYLRLAPKLRWVHLAYAGAESMLYPEFIESDIVLTTSRGLHKHQMTELLFGMMLTFTRRLRTFDKQKAQKVWDVSPYREMELLSGSTIGILGLGSIGSEIAKVAKGFGMRVMGLRNNPALPAQDVDVVLGPENLQRLLEESDHIVVVLPLTKETRNLITRKEFDLMKRRPYFYNLARGAIVNEEELIRALREGKVKGAGLDVFVEEPLPASSPLWEMENVILTPHVGGFLPHYMTEAVTLFLENLQRYLEGKELLNVVIKERGY